MAPKGRAVSAIKRKAKVAAGSPGSEPPNGGGSTVVGFADDSESSRKQRRLRRRDSDDQVDRIILRKLKVNFDDSAIEGSPH
jgi:hypothetical protein